MGGFQESNVMIICGWSELLPVQDVSVHSKRLYTHHHFLIPPPNTPITVPTLTN